MRIPPTTVVLLAFSALAGCVSLKRTAEPRYFALRPVAGTPPAAAWVAPASAEVALVLGVLPLALPGHLERPQLVSWIGPDEMRIDQFVRWAEPLASGALRVLANDLATALPGLRVITAPWPASAAPQCRVRVAVDRFGLQPDGAVTLSGRFVVLPGSGERPLVTRAVDLRRPPDPGPRDPANAVEAMSALLADLAAEIAKAVAACRKGGSCDHTGTGPFGRLGEMAMKTNRLDLYASQQCVACGGAGVCDHAARRGGHEGAQPSTGAGLPRSPIAPRFHGTSRADREGERQVGK